MKTDNVNNYKYLDQLNDKEYFELQEYKNDITTFEGHSFCIKETRSQLPQMIVNSWNSILLAEQPGLKISNKEIEFDIDLKRANTAKLAYGNAIIVPTVKDNVKDYEVYYEGSDEVKAVDVDGVLIALEYKKRYKDIGNNNVTDKHIHKLEDKIYTYKVLRTVDGQDKGVVFNKEYMNVNRIAPFRIYNTSASLNGFSVYHHAKPHINIIDNLINRIKWEFTATEPKLFIPDNLTDGVDSRNESSTFIASDERLFRLFPTPEGISADEDGNQKPVIWKPGVDVAPMISTINFELSFVSQLSGFGSRFFSYDKDLGFKTATEIVSEKEELYKFKCMHDRDTEFLIVNLIQAFNILFEEEVISADVIDITFSDAIIVDDEAQIKKYFEDYKAGVLDKYTYMELVGYSEEIIDKVRESEPADIMEEGFDINANDNDVDATISKKETVQDDLSEESKESILDKIKKLLKI